MGLEGAELTYEAPEPAVPGVTELVSSGSGWDCLGGFGEMTVIVSLLQPRPQGSCCHKPWQNSRALPGRPEAWRVPGSFMSCRVDALVRP